MTTSSTVSAIEISAKKISGQARESEVSEILPSRFGKGDRLQVSVGNLRVPLGSVFLAQYLKKSQQDQPRSIRQIEFLQERGKSRVLVQAHAVGTAVSTYLSWAAVWLPISRIIGEIINNLRQSSDGKAQCEHPNCKTFMRRFESDPRLHKSTSKRKPAGEQYLHQLRLT
jgi:hypothetical protein